MEYEYGRAHAVDPFVLNRQRIADHTSNNCTDSNSIRLHDLITAERQWRRLRFAAFASRPAAGAVSVYMTASGQSSYGVVSTYMDPPSYLTGSAKPASDMVTTTMLVPGGSNMATAMIPAPGGSGMATARRSFLCRHTYPFYLPL